MDGGHAEYLNKDKNLLHLHALVLAETKLETKFKTLSISKVLSEWDIIGRYDAGDSSKHMGLMLLAPRKSNNKLRNQLKSVTYQPADRNGNLQIQGLIIRTTNSLNTGFIYCRSTPNDKEVKAINKYFAECHALLGDFNLSPRDANDLKKHSVIKQKQWHLKKSQEELAIINRIIFWLIRYFLSAFMLQATTTSSVITSQLYSGLEDS